MDCNCRRNSDPATGNPESLVRMPDMLFFRSGLRSQVKAIDECIADPIRALWAANVLTFGSCCGHNGEFGDPRPSIGLAEGERVDRARSVLDAVDDREWVILQWRSLLPGEPEVLGRVLRDGTFLEGRL